MWRLDGAHVEGGGQLLRAALALAAATSMPLKIDHLRARPRSLAWPRSTWGQRARK